MLRITLFTSSQTNLPNLHLFNFQLQYCVEVCDLFHNSNTNFHNYMTQCSNTDLIQTNIARSLVALLTRETIYQITVGV